MRMTEPEKYPAWRSVETAPKNGTPILGFIADDPEFVVVFYDPHPGNKDWKEVSGEFYHRYNITHWMPLPPLPDEVAAELRETVDIMREVLKSIPDVDGRQVSRSIGREFC